MEAKPEGRRIQNAEIPRGPAGVPTSDDQQTQPCTGLSLYIVRNMYKSKVSCNGTMGVADPLICFVLQSRQLISDRILLV